MKRILMAFALLGVLFLSGCEDNEFDYKYDYEIKKVIEPNEVLNINPYNEWEDKFILISCSENVVVTRYSPYEKGVVGLNNFWIIEEENKTGICDIRFRVK